MNFLSLDVGSTCCKCQLFSESGEILAYKSEEYPLIGREGEEYVYRGDLCARERDDALCVGEGRVLVYVHIYLRGILRAFG